MGQKTKAAWSGIQNLSSNARKQPKAIVEDVEEEGNFNCRPGSATFNLEKTDERAYQEAVVIEEKDGSLTLTGFLEDFEDEPLLDLDSDDEDEELQGSDPEYFLIQVHTTQSQIFFIVDMQISLLGLFQLMI